MGTLECPLLLSLCLLAGAVEPPPFVPPVIPPATDPGTVASPYEEWLGTPTPEGLTHVDVQSSGAAGPRR